MGFGRIRKGRFWGDLGQNAAENGDGMHGGSGGKRRGDHPTEGHDTKKGKLSITDGLPQLSFYLKTFKLMEFCCHAWQRYTLFIYIRDNYCSYVSRMTWLMLCSVTLTVAVRLTSCSSSSRRLVFGSE